MAQNGEERGSSALGYLGSPIAEQQYVPAVAGGLADGWPLRRSGSGAPGVTLTGVRIRGQGRRPTADGISLHIPAGQSVAFYDQADGSAAELLDVVAGRRRLRHGQVTVHGTNLASRRVDTLSAEQQWRVLIARTLLMDPQLVITADPAG